MTYYKISNTYLQIDSNIVTYTLCMCLTQNIYQYNTKNILDNIKYLRQVDNNIVTSTSSPTSYAKFLPIQYKNTLCNIKYLSANRTFNEYNTK